MKFFLIPLALLFISIIPNSAHAATKQPVYKWNGPSCDAGLPVCSIDPPDPDGNFADPCYMSHDVGYVPNAVEMASISLCQAARQAVIVPPDQRIRALNVVKGWAIKFAATLEANKDEAEGLNLLQFDVTNLKNLDGDWLIYQSYPTPSHWQAIVQDLIGLGVSSEIIG